MSEYALQLEPTADDNGRTVFQVTAQRTADDSSILSQTVDLVSDSSRWGFALALAQHVDADPKAIDRQLIEARAQAEQADNERHNAYARRWVPFPTNLLPEPVCKYVREAARDIGCDESYVGVAILAALAGTIGTARSVRIKRNFFQPPILWTAYLGASGTLKDAALRAAITTVQDREAKANEAHRDALAKYQQEKNAFKRTLRAWEKNTTEDGGTIGAQPQPPEKPVRVRYLAQDVTIEALAVMLEENPRGLLLGYPELASWFCSMDAYRNGLGNDASKWLTCYDAAMLQVDRKSPERPHIFVRHAAVSICGGIQPQVLRRILDSKQSLYDCGLISRFYFVYPPESSVNQLSDFEMPDKACEAMARVFRALADLEPREDGCPEVMRLAPAAWAEFAAYIRGEHTRDIESSCDELRPSFAKDKGRVARLALILHLAKDARPLNRPARPDAIAAETMREAIELVRWFKRETVRVYAWLSDQAEDDERRKLVAFIEGRDGRVTVRDTQRSCRWLGNSSGAKAALQELVDGGFGRWESPKPGPAGGKPSAVFCLSSHPPP